MMIEERTALSRWQIPDRPPRRRERSRWRRPPELLLIVGIGLIAIGLLVTFGPLAVDLGGTESPPFDADDESDGAGDSDANGDGASGTEGDDANGIRGAIGEVISGDDNPERAADEVISGEDGPERAAGDEKWEECFVE